jgi:serpin B
MSHRKLHFSAVLRRLSGVAALFTLAACTSQNVLADGTGSGASQPTPATPVEASSAAPGSAVPAEASAPAAPGAAPTNPGNQPAGQLGQPNAAQLADAAASNAFTLAMYPLVATGDNLVVSPFNARLALGMLAAGADGDTRTQLVQALRFAADTDIASQGGSTLQRYRELAGTGTRSADGVIQGLSLYNATSVWPASQIGLLAPWTESMRTSYGSEVSALDYAADPEAARARINSWTSDQTRTLIPSLIPPGGIHSGTQLVLVSATYFLGAWQTAFAPTRTAPRPFTTSAGQTADRDTMIQTGLFAYSQSLSLQIVRMPYQGNQLSMLLVMPSSGSVSEWISTLTSDAFAALLAGTVMATVDLEVPKFRTETSLILNQSMQQLGMVDAFSPAANFSGITSDTSLSVSMIIHKAVIEVSESGTEAAAATAVIGRGAGREVQRPSLRFNHPFAFFIVDDATGMMLFAGQVDDPTFPN